jgi:hypothetical protein
MTASVTVNKDFKVKHGLNVAEGGTFGSAVVVGTPTENTHAATKLYVDTAAAGSSVTVSGTAPVSPSNGQLWFDTATQRIHVYYSGTWSPMATLEDAELLQEHIHDTSIDGSGLIATTFRDGGFYNDPGSLVSAGLYSTTTWDETWDGGSSINAYS